MKRVWISWSCQRRSAELSKAFSTVYYYFDDHPGNRLKRYLFNIPRTVRIINRERPNLLFAQNPSLFLVMLAALLKPVYRYVLVNDLHTPYIKLKEPLRSLFWAMQRFCVSRSDLTLVTNEGMQNLFARGATAVLPDKLPEIHASSRKKLAGDYAVLYICTFSEDEPYESVYEAASLIDDRIHIYVSGSYGKAGWNPEATPSNLHLTGFIPEEAYFEMLNSVDAVMVLTSQDHCLVCGGYEAVAAGKPMILSDHQALRTYFSSGAVFVKNDSASIAGGIEKSRLLHEEHVAEIETLRRELQADWERKFEAVNNLLPSPASGS